jgi:hypothetical protein
MRSYQYVGPDEIKARVAADDPGSQIENLADLARWISGAGQGAETVTCTFVIDLSGALRIADRRSEHVACAGGEAVLSAGEVSFARGRGGWEVEAVTNQSTGYCPEPESWPAVAAALDAAGLVHPGGWTDELTFRRCERCGERNIVKDRWFVCDVCGAELPADWNFSDGSKGESGFYP